MFPHHSEHLQPLAIWEERAELTIRNVTNSKPLRPLQLVEKVSDSEAAVREVSKNKVSDAKVTGQREVTTRMTQHLTEIG